MCWNEPSPSQVDLGHSTYCSNRKPTWAHCKLIFGCSGLDSDHHICADTQSAKNWGVRKWGNEDSFPRAIPFIQHRISESNDDLGVCHSEAKETSRQMNTEVTYLRVCLGAILNTVNLSLLTVLWEGAKNNFHSEYALWFYFKTGFFKLFPFLWDMLTLLICVETAFLASRKKQTTD